MNDIVNNIFSVTDETFQLQALDTFQYQYANNPIYKAWTNALHIDPSSVQTINDIPFLPVSFFKTDIIVTGNNPAEVVFESSGTSQTVNSKHYVTDTNIYRRSFLKGFGIFYGNIRDYCIVGLLPSYLERSGSSLIMMVDELIKQSAHFDSGFYLDDFEKLANLLQSLEKRKQKTLLIGVTFALLDFAEQFPMKLAYTTIMETGGMKGRRKEMLREEVHNFLQQQWQVEQIHSEYGMTELLSQGYSQGSGIFKTVPWMKILVREEDDPYFIKTHGRGVINVIDLANVNSCSFIATDDVGVVNEDGSFEVLGRMDNSDLRGCSLMAL